MLRAIRPVAALTDYAMRLDTGQHLKMTQGMKLSARMIQSMEILQLSALALEERIEQEMEKNPILEIEEARGKEQTEKERVEDNGEQPMEVDSGSGTEDFKRLDDMTETYGDTWNQNTTDSADFHTPMRRDTGERDGKMDAMANTAARSEPLSDQLLDQWRYTDMPDDIRKAGEHVIEFIDDDGYIRVTMDQICQQARPGVTPESLETAYRLIRQRLEPTGIGARDLADCLAIQLDALLGEEPDDEGLINARTLVTDHLKDIEMNRLPKIAKSMGASMEEIKSAMAKLRRLDPHPGRQLAPERSEIIIPDVVIEYDPVHDVYVAALASGRTPPLRINTDYKRLAKDRSTEKGTRQFLAGNLATARWLIDAIHQRNSTLLRVVNVVLDAQRDFFDHGPEHLKPLPMINVADQLGIHVGTVSRAVADKYIQTPRGIFPLRQFFSGGTESSDGEEMSWAAVQAKLKAIVENEDKSKPMSDDALVEALKEQGIEIARRTVAKYRSQMNIPTARKRKEF